RHCAIFISGPSRSRSPGGPFFSIMAATDATRAETPRSRLSGLTGGALASAPVAEIEAIRTISEPIAAPPDDDEWVLSTEFPPKLTLLKDKADLWPQG